MLGELFNNPIISLFVLLLAVIIHEVAHGYMADRLGDPTARVLGRLTLNPIPHIDPVGSIIVPLVMLISGTGFIFGWAKPVPFDPFNLRNPRRDAALISLAGPLANLLLAIISSLVLHILISFNLIWFGLIFGSLLQRIIVINVVLAIFNLVPIHPLDGFKIVGGILPKEYARQWYELEPYGMIFLLLMIFPVFGTAPVHQLISPIINLLLTLLLPRVGSAGII